MFFGNITPFRYFTFNSFIDIQPVVLGSDSNVTSFTLVSALFCSYLILFLPFSYFALIFTLTLFLFCLILSLPFSDYFLVIFLEYLYR